MRYLPEDLAPMYGNRVLVGTDEVGCGCVAGPVAAAACILNPADPFFHSIDDSKSYGARPGRPIRQVLARGIMQRTPFTAVVTYDPYDINRLGMRRAADNCMIEACQLVIRLWEATCGDDKRELMVIVDGNERLDIGTPNQSHTKADTRFACVAAASILAKDLRDRIMVSYDALWPEYGFQQHVGYATVQHVDALIRWDLCPIHHQMRSRRAIRRRREKLAGAVDHL